MITLYELCGKDPDYRYSPYAWRTRLALSHKGLSFEGKPWRFIEKDEIAFSGQGKVPVIIDHDNDDQIIHDSWDIACYLDERYPDLPTLIPKGAEGLMKGFNHWADQSFFAAIRPLIIMPIYAGLDDKNAHYFRQTREKMLGMTLEDYAKPADEVAHNIAKILTPYRAVLEGQDYMGGNQPNYGDHILMGGFMWMKIVSDKQVLKSDDAFYAWRERMLDAYNGEGRNAPSFDVKPA